MHQPFRIDPQMPATSYKSYQIAAPLSTHWRQATCEEVACPHFLSGWRTEVDESTELGQRQAHYIRHDSARAHTEDKRPDGLTDFTYPAGQRCFRSGEHKVRLERPEHFIERGGDWRGNPHGERREHVSPDDWLDSFANHQDRLADRFRQG